MLAVFSLCINLLVSQIFQGVRCKRVARSIGSVGLYVPGGTAVLPSTALMLSVVCWRDVLYQFFFLVYCPHCSCWLDFDLTFISSVFQPAQIAGCKTVVLATPPSQDGSICKVFSQTYWIILWILPAECSSMFLYRRYCIVPRRLVSLTSLRLEELRFDQYCKQFSLGYAFGSVVLSQLPFFLFSIYNS